MNKDIVCIEGKPDNIDDKFMRFLLEKLKIPLNYVQFKHLANGKSEIANLKDTFFPMQIDKGNKVLLLLDYDYEQDPLNQTCASYKKDNIITDYYLIGENLKLKKQNNLENLLLSTAKNTNFINCFAQYETCIDKALAEKSKLFAYIDATSNKHNDINYPEIFDLKHTNFEPLKNFLNSHLST